MSDHRYTFAALMPDYVRAGAGLALTAGPLVFVNPISPLAYVLAVLTVLFVMFAARTAIRHMTRIRITSTGIGALGPLGGAIEWTDLSKVDLRYFSTRRDRANGWMQLRLGDGRRRLRLDSNLNGFASIAARAANEARARGVGLDPNTSANLAALGGQTATEAA